MRRLARAGLVSLSSLAAACGGAAEANITVKLLVSGLTDLDPFKANDRVAKVRLTVDGPERNDDAVRELSSSDRETTFELFPADRKVKIEASGLDALGNLVAYGRASDVQVDEDLTVEIPFRRLLAYVTHRPVCGGGCNLDQACVNLGQGYTCRPTVTGCNPACGNDRACVEVRNVPACSLKSTRSTKGPGLLYVIDTVTRTRIATVTLPGSAPRGLGVTTRGGEGVLVTYDDGVNGFVGYLDADDHQWTSIPLMRAQETALIGPGQKIGIAAGGGAIAFFDIDAKQVLKEVTVGGSVLDAALGLGGRRAIVVTDVERGVVLADLEKQTVTPLGDVLSGASGVGVTEDGRTAYITSSSERELRSIDFETAGVTSFAGAFAAPTGVSAYSDYGQSVIAVATPSGGGARALSFNVPNGMGDAFEAGVGTLPSPSDIVALPTGSRLLVVSAGTSSTTAGLTAIDATPEAAPDGSSVLYPRDPDESKTEPNGQVVHQRYQPFHVGVLYGH